MDDVNPDKVRLRVILPIAFEVYEELEEGTRPLFLSSKGGEAYETYCTLAKIKPGPGHATRMVATCFANAVNVPVKGVEDRSN